MKHLATLSLLLLLAAAAANAQQTFNPPAGVDYALLSTAPATADGEVSYQWYRNGEAIAGATAETYTVPAAEAHGSNVEFKRQAAVDGSCSGARQVFSNAVTVSFEEEVQPCGLLLDDVCWAAANVDGNQTFAARPDMYTKFYQWNRATAYSAADPLSPAWNATAITDATWTVNPCPSGWQLPTNAQQAALSASGKAWVGANSARGNAVAGMFYGPNAATGAANPCSLPDNMEGCVFLPASGHRSNSNGALTQGNVGYYWSSDQSSSTAGYSLYINGNNSSSTPGTSITKAYGFSVRCVQPGS